MSVPSERLNAPNRPLLLVLLAMLGINIALSGWILTILADLRLASTSSLENRFDRLEAKLAEWHSKKADQTFPFENQLTGLIGQLKDQTPVVAAETPKQTALPRRTFASIGIVPFTIAPKPTTRSLFNPTGAQILKGVERDVASAAAGLQSLLENNTSFRAVLADPGESGTMDFAALGKKLGTDAILIGDTADYFETNTPPTHLRLTIFEAKTSFPVWSRDYSLGTDIFEGNQFKQGVFRTKLSEAVSRAAEEMLPLAPPIKATSDKK